MMKVVSLLALLAAFGSFSTPTFAADEGVNAADEATVESPDADWHPGWHDRDHRYPQRGSIVCYARNITGRTFSAMGSWRTNRYWIQQRAVEQCRRSSFILGRTCRAVGCRSFGGWR